MFSYALSEISNVCLDVQATKDQMKSSVTSSELTYLSTVGNSWDEVSTQHNKI